MSFKLFESPFTLYLTVTTPDMDVEFGFPVSQMQLVVNPSLILGISSWIRLIVQSASWFGKTDFIIRRSPIILFRSSFQPAFSRVSTCLWICCR